MPDDEGYARALARLDNPGYPIFRQEWMPLLRALLVERQTIMGGVYSGPADEALRDFAEGGK